jgi:nucleotide-binding universal stress UspA family protein
MQVLEQTSMQPRVQPVEPATRLSFKKILLATDFSVASERAGAYAKAVAQHFDSELEIASIFSPSVAATYEEAVVSMTPAQMRTIAEENLERFAQDLHLDGIDTQLVLTEDHSPSSALLELSLEHGADLIVTGTHAKTGLSRLILGSTAEQLLRRANCPVLTVGPSARPPEEGLLTFKTILYATDLSPEAAKAASAAVAFAEDSAATLYCCCVLSPSDEGLHTRDELEASFTRRMKKSVPEGAYDWCTPEFVVAYGEAAASILELAQKVNADLIVLGARRASFWINRVQDAMTPMLLANAKCPVLTVS